MFHIEFPGFSFFFLRNLNLLIAAANFLGAANTINIMVYKIMGTGMDTKQRKKTTTL